jgi:hypothetical protein
MNIATFVPGNLNDRERLRIILDGLRPKSISVEWYLPASKMMQGRLTKEIYLNTISGITAKKQHAKNEIKYLEHNHAYIHKFTSRFITEAYNWVEVPMKYCSDNNCELYFINPMYTDNTLEDTIQIVDALHGPNTALREEEYPAISQEIEKIFDSMYYPAVAKAAYFLPKKVSERIRNDEIINDTKIAFYAKRLMEITQNQSHGPEKHMHVGSVLHVYQQHSKEILGVDSLELRLKGKYSEIIPLNHAPL